MALDRIRAMLDRLFGSEALDGEHEQIIAQLSDLERRQLETDAQTTELEARVAILEGAHHDEPLG